ncbi:MAG: hypothetical protein ACJA2H_001552 [Nitriliruptoraceae bacterium]
MRHHLTNPLFLACLTVVAVAAISCSSPTTFQQIRTELGDALVSQGATSEEATCALDAYDDDGTESIVTAYETGDQDAIDAFATQVGVDGGAADCFSQATMQSLLGQASAADIRDGFIVGFVQTGPPGSTEAQAGCVFDGLIDAGVTSAEMTSATATPAIDAALGAVLVACGIG